MRFLTLICAAISSLPAAVATGAGAIDNGPFPEDLNGSNFTYPWPVKLYRFASQHQELEMAFMDVAPTCEPNGKVVLALHGKNFCGATWEATARELTATGYRVILTDQVGFCKSTKPEAYQFSLQQLALNTNGLLRALGIENVTVMGHSMGGMMAVRYGLIFPESVEGLVLVNPIGLEDWKAKGVPYRSIDDLYTSETASNYTSIRSYVSQPRVVLLSPFLPGMRAPLWEHSEMPAGGADADFEGHSNKPPTTSERGTRPTTSGSTCSPTSTGAATPRPTPSTRRS